MPLFDDCGLHITFVLWNGHTNIMSLCITPCETSHGECHADWVLIGFAFFLSRLSVGGVWPTARSSLFLSRENSLTSTPNRDSIMNHSIPILAHHMRPLRLPINNPFQTGFARRPQRTRLHEAVSIVGNLLAWVAQVFHVCLRRGGVRRPATLRVFEAGPFQADQVARRGRSKKLGMSQRPFRSKRRVQGTKELHPRSERE